MQIFQFLYKTLFPNYLFTTLIKKNYRAHDNFFNHAKRKNTLHNDFLKSGRSGSDTLSSMNTQRQGSNTLEVIPTEPIEEEVDINKKVSNYIKN